MATIHYMNGTYRMFWQDPPDEKGEGDANIWYHRTQNTITVYMEGPKGARYVRESNPDENFVWALFNPLKVTAGSETIDVPTGSVVIVPPGNSTIELAADGSAWIGYTGNASDLFERCPNKDEYDPPLLNVAPITPWPEPVGGYKLRLYDLNATKGHCYVHRTAMTNFGWPIGTNPRDSKALSPHTHDDFEQVSMIHSGVQIHHVRRAWSRNGNEWTPDEHFTITAPGVAISKPPDQHTTQAVSRNIPVGLIDYFSPVRWDFSNVEGMVVNRDEYPMIAEQPMSYAGDSSVYAENDPRRAIEGQRRG